MSAGQQAKRIGVKVRFSILLKESLCFSRIEDEAFFSSSPHRFLHTRAGSFQPPSEFPASPLP